MQLTFYAHNIFHVVYKKNKLRLALVIVSEWMQDKHQQKVRHNYKQNQCWDTQPQSDAPQLNALTMANLSVMSMAYASIRK